MVMNFESKKTCSKCKLKKGLENFSTYKYKPKKDGTQNIGVRTYCNDCKNKYTQKWFKKNKGYKKEWRKKNPEKVKQENLRAKKRTDKWIEENKEVLKTKKRHYREKNKHLLNSKKPIQQQRARERLYDGYVISQITKRSSLSAKEVRNYPELIKTKRLIIKTKRLWKTSQN